jgi:hypothetical protein
MATYRMILAINSRMLSMLVDLLEGNPDIKLLGVTDFADPTPLPPAPPAPVRTLEIEALTPATATPASRYVGGRRVKSIGGQQLIEEVLRSGTADLPELKRAFTNAGFAPSSASPTLSRMIRDGFVERGLHARFRLASSVNGGARQ